MQKILIVDDEEAARYGIRRALEGRTTRIFEAASAKAARSLIQEAATAAHARGHQHARRGRHQPGEEPG